jgi:integrase/recombinase XerD
MSILTASWKYDLEARNMAPRTITGYTTSLERFARWLESQYPGEGFGLAQVDKHVIRTWIRDELTRLSPKSVIFHLNGVRAFFRWAVAEGEVTTDPCIGVRQPAVPEKIVTVPEQGDIKLLIKGCGADYTGQRDLTLLMIMADTGLRLSELVGPASV